MPDFLTRKNIYGLSLFVVPFLILVGALIKTNYQWTSDTNQYLFFNPFWAVFVVLLDKFFQEKLQSECDELKIKVNKLKAVLNDGSDKHDTDYLLTIIEERDNDLSQERASKYVQKMQKKLNSDDIIKKETGSPVII
jgi:hypothetical protein